MLIIKEIKMNKYNVIKVGRDCAILEITNRAGAVTEVMISLEDVNSVAKYQWSISPVSTYKVYIKSNKAGYLHRFIMQPGKNLVVDHINHDTFDNRRNNLRVTTQTENNMNRIDSTLTNIAGITLTSTGKYYVRLRKDGRCLYSKTFSSKDEAIKSRLIIELSYGLYINADLYRVMLTEEELLQAIATYSYNLMMGKVLERGNTAKIYSLTSLAA